MEGVGILIPVLISIPGGAKASDAGFRSIEVGKTVANITNGITVALGFGIPIRMGQRGLLGSAVFTDDLVGQGRKREEGEL